MTDDCIHGVALDETCVLCCRTSARQYRAERDNYKRDLAVATIEIAHLREAFKTMEKAANERERECERLRARMSLHAVNALQCEDDIAALRERHAELREWLLADGELATITVAAVVEQLDAWARREP